jgi:hypothetical protein
MEPPQQHDRQFKTCILIRKPLVLNWNIEAVYLRKKVRKEIGWQEPGNQLNITFPSGPVAGRQQKRSILRVPVCSGSGFAEFFKVISRDAL